MIRAMMFDLDGTLVQSEKLKALSYAIAVQQLLGLPAPDDRAIEAYREVVGASREAASSHIVERLDLADRLQPLLAEKGDSTPTDLLTRMRKSIYDDMVSDPQVLRDNRWPHTIRLLEVARESSCRTALATMSHRAEALHVLRALDLEQSLDAVLSREDVERPKPDPEIYLLAAERLETAPGECLVIEDSPAGARAGAAAGMNVIAMATPFTAMGLHSSDGITHDWIVHSPEELMSAVARRVEEHNRTAH